MGGGEEEGVGDGLSADHHARHAAHHERRSLLERLDAAVEDEGEMRHVGGLLEQRSIMERERSSGAETQVSNSIASREPAGTHVRLRQSRTRTRLRNGRNG
jgi:hypothetical protein